MKKIILLCCLLFVIIQIEAQTVTIPKSVNDLSRGNRIFYERGQLLLEAGTHLFMYHDTIPPGPNQAGMIAFKKAFNEQLLEKSNFNSVFCWDCGGYQLPSKIANKSWGRVATNGIQMYNGPYPGLNIGVDSNYDLVPEELPYKNSLSRLSYFDDEIFENFDAYGYICTNSITDPNPDKSLRSIENFKKWFASSRIKYPNTLLNFGVAKDCQEILFTEVKPDITFFNDYPWKGTNEYSKFQYIHNIANYRRFSIGDYHMALAGSGGLLGEDIQEMVNTNNAIPMGAYIQNIIGYYDDGNTTGGNKPTESELKFQMFINWTFGAKAISSFLYTYIHPYTGNAIGNQSWFEYLNPDYKKGYALDLLFDLQSGKPTYFFNLQAEINRQSLNIGPALVKLQTKDIRAIKNDYRIGESFKPYLLRFHNKNRLKPNLYLTNITATDVDASSKIDISSSMENESYIGFFRPIFDGVDNNSYNEEYFMVMNGKTTPLENKNTEQKIKLEFDFGINNTINSLLRLSRLSGLVEIVPLTRVNATENKYYLDLLLDGGEADLFKYNNGVPFVGVQKLSNR